MSLYAKYWKDETTRYKFLNLCIMNQRIEYLFEFLVSEYKQNPTKQRLLALYDVFCAPNAEMQLNAAQALPPNDMAIAVAVKKWATAQDEAKSDNVVVAASSSSASASSSITASSSAAAAAHAASPKNVQTESKSDNAIPTIGTSSLEVKTLNVTRCVSTAKGLTPPGDLFDKILKHVFHQEDAAFMIRDIEPKLSSPLSNFAPAGQPVHSIVAAWGIQRAILIGAGFATLENTFSAMRVPIKPPPLERQEGQKAIKQLPPPPVALTRQKAQRRIEPDNT